MPRAKRQSDGGHRHKAGVFQRYLGKMNGGRYLALIREGADKTLVPVFRNMSGYDLPPEFAHLQAQDMGKRGRCRIWCCGTVSWCPEKHRRRPAAPVHTAEIAPMLRRAYMCWADADYDKAAEILDDVLNRDPENVRAYVGLLMAELHVLQGRGFDGARQRN